MSDATGQNSKSVTSHGHSPSRQPVVSLSLDGPNGPPTTTTADTAGVPYIPPAFSSTAGASTSTGTVLFHLRRNAPFLKLFTTTVNEKTVQAGDIRNAVRKRLCALKPQIADQIILRDESTKASLFLPFFLCFFFTLCMLLMYVWDMNSDC